MTIQLIEKNNFTANDLDREWNILNLEQGTVTKMNQLGCFCRTLLKKAHTLEFQTQSVMKKFRVEIPLSNQDELIKYVD